MFGSKRRAQEEIRNMEMRRLMVDVRSDYSNRKINREEREKLITEIQNQHIDAIEYADGKLMRQVLVFVIGFVVGVSILAVLIGIVVHFV